MLFYAVFDNKRSKKTARENALADDLIIYYASKDRNLERSLEIWKNMLQKEKSKSDCNKTIMIEMKEDLNISMELDEDEGI